MAYYVQFERITVVNILKVCILVLNCFCKTNAYNIMQNIFTCVYLTRKDSMSLAEIIGIG